MKKIWHHYNKWECFRSGMWRKATRSEEKTLLIKAIEFTGNAELYGSFMLKVIDQWKHSCEHNLTDDGIPNEVDAKLESMNKIPSYRMLCRAILTNDRNLVTLGFQRKKSMIYGELKRIEISQRPNTRKEKFKQLELI